MPAGVEGHLQDDSLQHSPLCRHMLLIFSMPWVNGLGSLAKVVVMVTGRVARVVVMALVSLVLL